MSVSSNWRSSPCAVKTLMSIVMASVGKRLGQRAHPMPIGTKTGTVKSYNTQRGYGFIGPDDGGPDVFVHALEVQEAGMNYLREGQGVSFDIALDKRNRRPKAVNLRPM